MKFFRSVTPYVGIFYLIGLIMSPGFYLKFGDVLVWVTGGGKLYDGYWSAVDHSMEMAVEEALIGSKLITHEQRRFADAQLGR